METANYLEPNEGWAARGDEWAKLDRLLELARAAHRTELSQERRDQIRERVLERLEQVEARRRRMRVVLAAASALLAAGLLVTLTIGRTRR